MAMGDLTIPREARPADRWPDRCAGLCSVPDVHRHRHRWRRHGQLRDDGPHGSRRRTRAAGRHRACGARAAEESRRIRSMPTGDRCGASASRRSVVPHRRGGVVQGTELPRGLRALRGHRRCRDAGPVGADRRAAVRAAPAPPHRVGAGAERTAHEPGRTGGAAVDVELELGHQASAAAHPGAAQHRPPAARHVQRLQGRTGRRASAGSPDGPASGGSRAGQWRGDERRIPRRGARRADPLAGSTRPCGTGRRPAPARRGDRHHAAQARRSAGRGRPRRPAPHDPRIAARPVVGVDRAPVEPAAGRDPEQCGGGAEDAAARPGRPGRVARHLRRHRHRGPSRGRGHPPPGRAVQARLRRSWCRWT